MRVAGRARVARAVAAALLCFVVACADLSGNAGIDAGTNTGDGGVAGCDMSFTVSPPGPIAPVTLVLTGEARRFGGVVSGVQTYAWEVSRAGAPLAVVPRDPDGKQIEVIADISGTYRVTLRGTVGGYSCTDGLQQINVSEPGAASRAYRLRLSPAAGQPAPVQDKVFTIPGGADYALGAIGLDTGLQVQGALVDQGSAPLAGYLRATPVGGASLPDSEAFAGSSGTYALRLLPGTYDLLAVPSGNTVAPIRFASLSTSGLSTSLTVPAGQAITGTVQGPTGAALSGATVAMRIDGVPTTIAATDAAGTFSVVGRGGGQAQIVVTPPDGSGLLQLSLNTAATLTLTGSESLAIRYAAAAAYRDLDVPVFMADATTPAPAARVVFIARSVSASGTVTAAGQSAVSMEGRLRKAVLANASGRVTARLPEAIYDVIVEAPTGAAAVDSARLFLVDLSSGMPVPTALALGGAATLTGRVADADGTALAGVRVAAVPRGLIAGVPAAATNTTTDQTGAYTLRLIGGGSYELVVDAVGSVSARARMAVVAPSAGASSVAAELRLERAIRVTGTVSIVGVAGGAAGVHVSVLCFECAGLDPSAPLADGLTDASGAFTLAVPDPGVGN